LTDHTTEKTLRGYAYLVLGDGHVTVPPSIATSALAKQAMMRLLAEYDLPDETLIFEETDDGLAVRADPTYWIGFSGHLVHRSHS
jgi:hypothetical protein